MIMATQDKFWKVSILHNIERNHHSHFRLQKPCQRRHIKPMAMVVLQLYALVAKRYAPASLCSLSSLLFSNRGLNNYGLWRVMGNVKLVMEIGSIQHGPFDLCHLRFLIRNHSLCQTCVKFIIFGTKYESQLDKFQIANVSSRLRRRDPHFLLMWSGGM